MHISAGTTTVSVDGVSVGETHSSDATMFAFDSPCNGPTTYAIDSRGTGGTDAIIANLNHCGVSCTIAATLGCVPQTFQQ